MTRPLIIMWPAIQWGTVYMERRDRLPLMEYPCQAALWTPASHNALPVLTARPCSSQAQLASYILGTATRTTLLTTLPTSSTLRAPVVGHGLEYVSV